MAMILAVAALASWLLTGANRGWTKTSVPVTKKDPVTEIEYPDFQKRFYPGVDFLGATLLGAGILAGASFLIRKKPNTT